MKFIYKKSAHCRNNIVSFVDEKHTEIVPYGRFELCKIETHTVAIITSPANILSESDRRNLEQFAKDNSSRLATGPIVINIMEIPA